MTEPEQKDIGWQVTRVWLNAIEETARDFHGTRPKSFCMRAYEHATNNWIQILEGELEIHTPPAETVLKAVENYIVSGVEAGLFNDPNEFELEQLPSGGIKVTVKQCPYQNSCEDLLERGLSLQALTCARLGCFRAATAILATIDCNYEIQEVKLGEACIGVIEPK